jgi:hypothetical protein
MSAPIFATLFVYDPKRPAWPIRKLSLPLLHCERTAWALLPDGRRKLLGVSAFFTLASARRAQIGAVEERLGRKFAARLYPGAQEYYKKVLAELRRQQQAH